MLVVNMPNPEHDWEVLTIYIVELVGGDYLVAIPSYTFSMIATGGVIGWGYRNIFGSAEAREKVADEVKRVIDSIKNGSDKNGD